MHEGILGSNLLQLVALGIQLLPEHILEFLDSLSGDGRDEDHRQIGRQRFAEHLDKLIIEKVALGDGEHTVLVEHLWVEVLQLAQQHLVFLLDIVGIAGNHEEEQRVALYVAQESQT